MSRLFVVWVLSHDGILLFVEREAKLENRNANWEREWTRCTLEKAIADRNCNALGGAQGGIMKAKGVNGEVTFDGSEVVISRKGVIGFLAHGFKGEKSISVAHISSIQFKKAGLINGYIQFAFLGGQENKAGLWDATHDENTVMFNSWHQAEFEALRDAIKEKIRTGGAPAAPSSPSSLADEIDKLAALRDRGILSADEFEIQKRKMLGQ